MPYDPFESEVNYPPHQKSREPKYKTIFFFGELQDDLEDWYSYYFHGNYYEHEGMIRFVEAYVSPADLSDLRLPIIPDEELQNILRFDIREELNTDYSIIFETKIELK
jgi:hypothetical protein